MAIGGRNIVWEWGVPRVIQGYFDLGPIQIPPQPRQIVLTDRADGTQWLVIHDITTPPQPSDGKGRVAITTSIPQVRVDKKGTQQPDPSVQVYAAGEEPYVFVGTLAKVSVPSIVRLIVRSGRLGLELLPISGDLTGQSQGTIYIRSPLQQTVVAITLPIVVAFDPIAHGVLSWSTVTLP